MQGYADMILQAVCDYYSRPDGEWSAITLGRLAGKESEWPIEEARGVLIFLWFTEGGLQNREIAARLGRDETTTVRLRHRIRNRLLRDDVALTQKILPALYGRLERMRNARRIPTPRIPAKTTAR